MKYTFAPLLLLCFGLSACTTLTKQDAEMDIPEESPASVYTNLGKQYLERGQDDLALENFKEALKADSGNSEAHHSIAILYQKLDQKNLWESHLKQAVSLRPSNASAQTDYGVFLCAKGNYAEADEHFKKAIGTPLYRRPWVAMTNAGICAQRAGRLEDAENYLREALKQQPDFSPALLAMAELSLNTNKPMSGRAFIQRYMSHSTPSAEALLLGVKIEQALGDTTSAKSYRSQLEGQFPDSKEAESLRDLPE
ncbi:MAG: type IV pilus biogenesis/stability protein PilW [Methylococcaceae bacterium]|nr:type IV pilus biogenesis/stability protein PilW [Methylococcaceae bacterium]MCI0668313.1 type IV pilus biogenesis/stability protein PilW [Methylococcaceae bacterium]MCI0733754.1 type IV pilus biogenesis/stability protein PilW [Methylococcaceae bacterium]